MRKSALIIAGIATLGVIGASSPAFAAGTPVRATVTVATTLTLDGINPSVPFGTVIPGTTSTVTNAESPHVVTNTARGASILVTPQNGGFHIATGQSDIIPDSAVSVTTTGQGTVQLLNGAPVNVAHAGMGDNTYQQDWSIHPDSATPAGDPLFADFEYSAIAA
jgi:hypothetical protein